MAEDGTVTSKEFRRSPGPITAAAASRITTLVIDSIESGTAPFLRKWNVAPAPPFNPVNGKPYRGVNALMLGALPYEDPRWVTFADASRQGWRIRKGEKASPIFFWRKSISELKQDANGRVIRVDRPVSRPVLSVINVFNAEQISGIGRWSAPPIDSEKQLQVARSIIEGAKISIVETDGPPRYDVKGDTIYLPPQSAFPDELAYTRTALRVIGQWTSHLSRLDRADKFAQGTPEYALEELRVQLYSYLLASRLQLGHDPKDHAAIGQGWVDILKLDPKEILMASRDSHLMVEYVSNLSPGVGVETDLDSERSVTNEVTLASTAKRPPNEDFRDRIKQVDQAVVAVDPKREFKSALQAYGLIVDGDPIMDGRWHRVAVVRDKPKRGDKAGAYRGFLDGRPAGSIFNHYTNQSGKWKLEVSLTRSDRVKLAKSAAVIVAARRESLEASYDHKAALATRYIALLPPAAPDHPYLVSKGITPDPGLRQNRKGYLVVPLRNARGEIRSFLKIGPGGFKNLMKGGEKVGNFYLIEGSRGVDQNRVVLVSEGYSTGRTLSMATGLPVVVGVDAGNLPAVASNARSAIPKVGFVFAGEVDSNRVGELKAREAAKIVGGDVVLPEFEEGQRAEADKSKAKKSHSDFNDLARVSGLESVRSQLMDVVKASNARVLERLDKALDRSRSISR